MLIYTAKLTKTKLALFVGAVFLVLLLIIAAVSSLKTHDAAGTAALTVSEVSFKNIRDNGDRIAFLNAFGWEVGADPVAIEEVVIPEEFDGVYAQYNELQRYQGLDLEKYRGKTAKRYTYEVTNYPGNEDNVVANLLIYKNRVIGGDVCSTEYRGFMHGFERTAG
ncbi:MAG: DUF4830 domain-containing protein [Clostridiaceae bacterium]|nr:DUF4830 domain-containing protein [Clostridiales bacterium]MDD6877449.1 DUF4830 domain-containing protein [Clostridiaceae bacterium]MDY3071331.1 DUF4830 domain-containing protein [Eubacteriales bacterium]MDY3285246.1 DUF4830 domain-containing protein [Eubacteriales bacterium]MDY5015117.1 DUF4830 domain-containing protein [Eubacteriales bacterium]